MKISWLQGGLHIAPETKQETDALMMLWEAKKEVPNRSNPEPPAETLPSVVLEQSKNVGIAG